MPLRKETTGQNSDLAMMTTTTTLNTTMRSLCKVSRTTSLSRNVYEKKKAKPLTIAPLANTDFRALAKKKKDLFVPSQGNQESSTQHEVMTQPTTGYGLQVPNSTRQHATATESEEIIVSTPQEKDIPQDNPKSLDSQAVDAILHDVTHGKDGSDDDEHANLVIPSSQDEAAAFRQDVADRADDTTLETYEKIPVDAFGEALLRGLGWNKGEGIGRNRMNTTAPVAAPPVKQREALLGLGAKPQDEPNDRRDAKQRSSSKRTAYEYKDTSLFKKISKKRYDDDVSSSDRSDRHSSSKESSRHSSRESSRHSSRDSSRERGSSSRRDRDRDRDRDGQTSSSSRRRSRSRSPSRRSRPSSSSSSSSRHR
ncbi:DExH-box splicing factor binding site-domain-containing protein [Gongronella butleri]|nr:DExH-box splicing factor binding site-domain-containing protein [Gongronella butleri]